MDTANQFLGSEKIGALMRKYAIPCIISLLVGALYNIVDQIFIANAQLSRLLRQRGQHGGLSFDGGGAVHRCSGGGWLLRFRQHQPGQERGG